MPLSQRALAGRAQVSTREDYLDGLNPAQLEAVRALDGPVLMLAGAGTGKTKALTLKSLREVMLAYLRLVKEVHITRSSGATGLPLNPSSATYKRMSAKGGDGRY